MTHHSRCLGSIRQYLPNEITVCEGQLVKLTIPTIWPQPWIQWQVKKPQTNRWAVIPGETNFSLVFTAQAQFNGYIYRAIVCDKCGCWRTNDVLLNVNYIIITENPVSYCFRADTTATFTAQAEGNPTPTVQWQVSSDNGLTWADLPGETSTTLTFTVVPEELNNQYRAVFTNSCASVATTAASLSYTVLKIDDGISYEVVQQGAQQWLWLNRLTPPAYPFTLEQIQVSFTPDYDTSAQVGDPIDLYIWENTAGNVDPSIGAVLVGSLVGQTVQSITDFSTYSLPTPIVFNSGDIILGVVNRLPLASPRYPTYYIASKSGPATEQGRSWIAGYTFTNAGVAPNPPPLPNPPNGFGQNTWLTTANLGLPGSWMIRGLGCGPSGSSAQLSLE